MRKKLNVNDRQEEKSNAAYIEIKLQKNKKHITKQRTKNRIKVKH